MAHKVYPLPIHSQIGYSINVYEPFLPQVVRQLFREEIQENAKGVNRNGKKYYYSPSAAYMRMLNKNVKLHKNPKNDNKINK